jgi:glycosyltransferase involved in cell wall biosynthesis
MIDPRAPDFHSPPSARGAGAFVYRPGGGESGVPAVSVVTPCRDCGPELLATARSVLGQSLQNFEWILVDDGTAEPAALARLREVGQRDARIRLLAPEGAGARGPGAARNRGVRAAAAPLVFFLDGDDEIEPTTLEKCALYMASHPDAAFVKGYNVAFGAAEYLYRGGFHDGRAFLHDNRATVCAMIRAEVLAAVGGFDESMRGGLEDWHFWLRCAQAGRWGGTIPEFLDWYRRRERHTERWPVWDNPAARDEFVKGIPSAFPRLATGWFPDMPSEEMVSFGGVGGLPPLTNPLAGARGGKRILLIVPWFTMGGADKFNLRLMEQLRARGFEITVCATTPGDQSWLPEFTAITPDVFVLPHLVRQTDAPMVLRYLLESRRPDIVLMSNSELAYVCLPYMRACAPWATFVDYTHMEEEAWKNGGWCRYGVGWQDLLEMNIVTSRHLRNWMISRGADGDRVEVCTINEDPEQWRVEPGARERERAALGIAEGVPTMVYPARLCQQKQPDVFLKTLLALRESGQEVCALVAGDGPDRAYMEEFIREHGLEESVLMLGSVPAAKMPGVYAAADLFFLPSHREGIALSIFEAMACGLAIVGADVGGQAELVTPECGVLAPKGLDKGAQVAWYAKEVSLLLKDSTRREAMGRAGQERIASEFSLTAMGDRMVSLFERAQRYAKESPREVPSARTCSEIAMLGIEYMNVERRLCEVESRLNGVGARGGAPLRHELADRLNDSLKRVGLSSVLKRLVGRAIDREGKPG